MNFIDELNIEVLAGDGGKGVISFNKNKKNKIIPDGGNGGKGGSIIFISDNKENGLLRFRYYKFIIAKNGNNGLSNNKNGASAKDVLIKIPKNSKIIDANSKKFIFYFSKNREKLIVAKGGLGGIGNSIYKKKKI